MNGSPIAESTPSDDQYQYQRKYTNGALYRLSPGTSRSARATPRIESAENAVLSGNSDASFFQNLNAILTGQDVQGDNVNLTIDRRAAGRVRPLGQNTGAGRGHPAEDRQDPRDGVQARLRPERADLARHRGRQAAVRRAAGTEPDPLQNRAIGGDLYTPIVFKLIVASAALKDGKYDLDSEFPNRRGCSCRTSTYINNRRGRLPALAATRQAADAIQ